MSPFVHHEEYKTNVYTDATSQFAVEVDVGTEAVPVAVECKTDEFALSIEHRRTGIAPCNVVVRKETELLLDNAFGCRIVAAVEATNHITAYLTVA